MTNIKRVSFLVLMLVLSLALPSFVIQAAVPKLSKTKCTLEVGQKKKLKLKNTTGTVTWSSSDSRVAKVSKKGVVTARKPGTAVITAKYNKKSYTCKVKVTETGILSKDDQLDLVMWCDIDKYDSQRVFYDKAIADLKKKYPGINLTMEGTEYYSYRLKIKAALVAEELPDIFTTFGGSFLKDFSESGALYNLNEVLDAYKKDLSAVMCQNSTFEDKLYGVPSTFTFVCMYANMDILKSVGYEDIPKTYYDLVTCCNALIKKGITPFGCAMVETWCCSEYIESIVEKTMGAEALRDIFLGRESFDNKEFKNGIDEFLIMLNEGYFGNDCFKLSNDDIIQRFVDGEYAFYINGSWNCGNFDSLNSTANIRIGEFPVIDETLSSAGQFIGGPSEMLSVSASSPNAKKAAAYAFELSKLVSKYEYLDGQGIPAWNIDYDDSKVMKLLQDAAHVAQNASTFVLYGDTCMKYEDFETYATALNYLLRGEYDNKEFIKFLAENIR